MALEKERRKIQILLIIGAACLILGLVLLLTVSTVGGIIVLILGVAICMICMAIQNFFYRFDMFELQNRRRKSE